MCDYIYLVFGNQHPLFNFTIQRYVSGISCYSSLASRYQNRGVVEIDKWKTFLGRGNCMVRGVRYPSTGTTRQVNCSHPLGVVVEIPQPLFQSSCHFQQFWSFHFSCHQLSRQSDSIQNRHNLLNELSQHTRCIYIILRRQSEN